MVWACLLKYLKQSPPPPPLYHSLGTKLHIRSHERGMTLIEVILMAVFLITAAIGTAHFFAQTRVTMSSSSQAMSCQTIAKEALDNVVSLGARLYGYKINYYADSKFSYKPLFIKYNTGNPGNIEHVNSGSELHFPPDMYRTLYENLGVSFSIQDPETNTGHPLIGNTYPYDLSTSVLLVNSVNALQYLYNSDNRFFTDNAGKGKKYTSGSMSIGGISELLKKYEDRFNLEDMEFYVKIAPIDLTTNEEMTSPSNKILTRPRFHNPKGALLIPALNVLGDENAGFEITVMLKYEREDQEYTCDASHRFSHQVKPITKRSASLSVNLTGLVSGAKINLKDNADLNVPPLTPAVPSDLKMVSCDTHGGGYDDITLTVDFNNIEESQQIGTVILCQMNSYCRSYGEDSYGVSCSPEWGLWQRCHQVDPKPSSDQSWTYTSELNNEQVLKMMFSGMKVNRRYELLVGEFSMAGHNLRKKMIARFYIDAQRPTIRDTRITNDAVGSPTDGGTGNRDYQGPFTHWTRPPNSTNKWLQCDQSKVEFLADIEDQFTHNLEKCDIEGKREDGTNKGTGAATSPTRTSDCGGELTGIQHGRQTITFIPSDSCDISPNTKDLVWDTDLPGTFQAQNFPSNPKWLKSTDKDTYTINTEIPAKNQTGKFPKHYSVDCNDKFMAGRYRKDGNSGQLNCELEGSDPDHDDGCNPIKMASKYYHVCGGAGVCEDTNWAVYVPLTESCLNVRCEQGLSCCDDSSGTCNGVSDKQCGDPKTRHCTHPKGGTQAKADEVPSGCPPLGLNNCSYKLPCEASSPFDPGDRPTGPCGGQRKGDICSFPKTYSCVLQGSSTRSNAGDFSGLCDGRSGFPCTIPDTCSRYAHFTDTETRTRCGTPPIIVGGVCQNPETYTVQVSCSHCNQWSATSANCPPITFTGSCGQYVSGSCSKKGEGGGNLSLEQCEERAATCGGINPPPPECGSSPPLGNCKNGTGSTATLIAGTTDTYEWTCSVGSLSTTCTGSANTNTPTCDVNVHGAACCPVSSGGTCTGQLCAINCETPETCHVKDVGDGVCRPSCGHLGILRGHGIGADGILDTPDDERAGTWYIAGANTCADLNTIQWWGSTDWIKIPLIEGKDPWEMIKHGGGACCGRNITPTPGTSPPRSNHCLCTGDAAGCEPRCSKEFYSSWDNTYTCRSRVAGLKDTGCVGGQSFCGCTADGCGPGCVKEMYSVYDNQYSCKTQTVGLQSTSCGGSTCLCTDWGCSVGCKKETKEDGTWVCKNTSGRGGDSGICDGSCNSSVLCCRGDSYPDNLNCKTDGVCDESRIHGCEQGTVNVSYQTQDCRQDSGGLLARFHEWQCKGPNGGSKVWCSYKEVVECCHSTDCSSGEVCLSDFTCE